jgi:hypothetical protein
MNGMRRIPAILLVFLFSFSLIAPALSVDGQSNLPACCRRDGKHRCGMLDRDMAEAPSSGPAVDAVRIKCPLFPNGGAVVPECGPALLAASQTAGIALVSQIADRARSEAGYRIALSRSHHKRGPPTLLSL